MRARCGGGAAAWVAGVLAAPGTQGSWWPGQQEIYCCRLNPYDELGRLCVYGIYKKTLIWPTKESILVLIAVNIGDKKI